MAARRRRSPAVVIVHKLWRNTLHRHVTLVVAGKFLLLLLLWWLCVRDYQRDPGSTEVRAALLPESPPVVETRKDSPP